MAEPVLRRNRAGRRTGHRGPAGRGSVDRRHVRCLLSRCRTTRRCPTWLCRSTWTRAWRLHPQVSVRPERFGALLYHFGTRRLSFLKHPALLTVVESLDDCAHRAGGLRGGRRRGPPACPPSGAALATLAASTMIEPAGGRAVTGGTGTAAAGRAVPVRPGRADLPDLGAHLRLQPGLRALPVQLGPPRPARAEHRRVPGGDRRARAHAGVLRQHRRRRADRPAGLLGAGGLRHRPPRRGEVLHQRREDHPGGGRAAGRQRLRRRADLAGRRDRRGQRRGPRPGLVRHGAARDGAPGRRRVPRLQDLRGHDPAEREPAGRVQGARRPVRRAAAADPAAPVGPRRGRLGRAAPDRGPAARALRLADRARRAGADRRLVLPPGRVRRARCPG